VKTILPAAFLTVLASFLLASCAARGPVDASGKPRIIKHGTIDCDLVETAPVVFQGKLYRLEYVRNNYWNNQTGDSYFRFIDLATGKPTESFAKGYHFGCAYAQGDTLYVAGTKQPDGGQVDLFASQDMKTWTSWNALDLPGYGIFNTSLCKADDRYVLMFEIGKPEEIAGERFTALFAESKDLKTWKVLSPECNYAKDRYTAPHCLRYLDGWFYDFYLEAFSNPRRFHTYVVRSRDLIHWQSSPLNPVLEPSPEDKHIANPSLPPEQQQRIRDGVDVNTSDIDFIEYQGKLVINYSWGTQRGQEFTAEASYHGTLEQFLKGWFPNSR